jgi:hypothetical protein
MNTALSPSSRPVVPANWGSRAKKNTVSFGLRTLTVMPWTRTPRRVAGPAADPSTESDPVSRHVVQASHSR